MWETKYTLRGVNPYGFSEYEDPQGILHNTKFNMSGHIAASGNVMSLIDGEGITTEIPQEYCFYNLFSGCSTLTQAPDLPATTLTDYCYENMFSGCTSLSKAPELPASELKQECYKNMFKECSDLNYIKVGVMTLDNDADATTDWVAGGWPRNLHIPLRQHVRQTWRV